MAHAIILKKGTVSVLHNVSFTQKQWRDAYAEDGVEIALLIENQVDLNDARSIQATPGCEEYNWAGIRDAAKKIKDFVQ